MQEGVSVIICCHNSEKRIPDVLKHLMLQRVAETISWEVILVDNASEDDTVEVAKRTWNLWDHVPLRFYYEPEKGLSNARKKGILESAFNIVSFIDDDNWVNERWVQDVYLHMKNYPEVAIIGGKGEAVFEQQPPEWFDRFKRCFAVGPQTQKDGFTNNDAELVYGAGLSLRKDAWDSILKKGFYFHLSGRKGNSLSSGEDSEMCLAVRLSGYKILYDSQLTFKHLMPASRLKWSYLMKLASAFGRAQVIIDIYESVLQGYGGWDKLKITNYFLSLLYSLYGLLKIMPKFILDNILLKSYPKSEHTFHYLVFNFVQKLNSCKEYRKAVNSIYGIRWKDA
jgi:glycosyltransferase involved in cell wall biosynthesis